MVIKPILHPHCVDAPQVRAKQKRLNLSWDVSPEVPVHLVGDAGRLQQCILNLGMMPNFFYFNVYLV